MKCLYVLEGVLGLVHYKPSCVNMLEVVQVSYDQNVKMCASFKLGIVRLTLSMHACVVMLKQCAVCFEILLVD